VLIADDYAPLRESLRAVLENAGLEVIEAENGAVALQVVVANDVDVMLVDLKMPVCDGYEVLRRLGEPAPPVIVLSAFEQATAEDVQTEFGPKVFAALRKPVSPGLLLDTVRRAVESYRTAKTLQSSHEVVDGLVTWSHPL